MGWMCLTLCVGANAGDLSSSCPKQRLRVEIRSPRVSNGIIMSGISECGCPFDAVVYSAAAQGGSVEILQYLRSAHPGCHWDPQSCAHNAVTRGHLAMLQYLHTEGCDWQSWDCCYAARYGHLLKYLREHGCPWDAVSPANAAGQGHLEVIEYLQE